jgi:hypothetical protein
MSYIGAQPTTAAFPFDQFSGNGSTTAFTLSYAPASPTSLVVTISGVVQNPSTYTVSGLTLTFSAAPPSGTDNIGVLFLGLPASGVSVGGSSFPSGTAMLFVQTAAPTGWTKSTTHDNKALRVVSGAASSGGSVAFTTAFASQAVSGSIGNTTLSTAQIASHVHGLPAYAYLYDSPSATLLGPGNGIDQFTTDAAGGGGGGAGAHNHTFTGTAINLAVSYVDVIIATKD